MKKEQANLNEKVELEIKNTDIELNGQAKNSRVDRFEEIPQNIGMINRKCEKLGDKQLE